MKGKLKKEIFKMITDAISENEEIMCPKRPGEVLRWTGVGGCNFPSGSFLVKKSELILRILDFLDLTVEHIPEGFSLEKRKE